MATSIQTFLAAHPDVALGHAACARPFRRPSIDHIPSTDHIFTLACMTRSSCLSCVDDTGLQRLARPQANSCVGFRDDASGHKGIFIDTGVLKAAAVGAIASTLRSLGPRVLPWRELVRRGSHFVPGLVLPKHSAHQIPWQRLAAQLCNCPVLLNTIKYCGALTVAAAALTYCAQCRRCQDYEAHWPYCASLVSRAGAYQTHCLSAWQSRVALDKHHQPDFSAAFQHLAVHPGALPVISKVAQVKSCMHASALHCMRSPQGLPGQPPMPLLRTTIQMRSEH